MNVEVGILIYDNYTTDFPTTYYVGSSYRGRGNWNPWLDQSFVFLDRTLHFHSLSQSPLLSIDLHTWVLMKLVNCGAYLLTRSSWEANSRQGGWIANFLRLAERRSSRNIRAKHLGIRRGEDDRKSHKYFSSVHPFILGIVIINMVLLCLFVLTKRLEKNFQGKQVLAFVLFKSGFKTREQR